MYTWAPDRKRWKAHWTIELKQVSSAVIKHSSLAISVLVELLYLFIKSEMYHLVGRLWWSWQDQLLFTSIQCWLFSKGHIWLSGLKESIVKCKIRQKLNFPSVICFCTYILPNMLKPWVRGIPTRILTDSVPWAPPATSLWVKAPN